MLSLQEMIAVCDRHHNGRWVDVVAVRRELRDNWGLDEIQEQRVIWDMIDEGII